MPARRNTRAFGPRRRQASGAAVSRRRARGRPGQERAVEGSVTKKNGSPLIRFEAQDDIEVAELGPLGAPVDQALVVEAITKIESEKAEHRQKRTQADPDRAVEVEGTVVLEILPCVRALDEHEAEDRRPRVEGQRVPEFERELVEDRRAPVGVGGDIRDLVAAGGDDVLARDPELLVAETVTPNLEPFERRSADIPVVEAEVGHLGRRLDCSSPRCVPTRYTAASTAGTG